MIGRPILTLLLAASAAAQQPATVSFSAQTRLVLLSFHVRQGKQFVPDLKAEDVTLFEDGKPRPFTIFDSPATQGRIPLELVLLFDVNPAIPYFWDPADVFRFAPRWEETMTRQLLEKQDADVRISVYATTGQKLYRLTGATTDARIVTRDFRGLLNARASWRRQASIFRSLCLRRETKWATAHSRRISRPATF